MVVHDTLGLSRDVRNQADWLAGEGFLALAPELQYWGRRIRCLMSFVRDWERPLSDLESTRAWLARQERCTGTTGVIGFCMGGGLALTWARSSQPQLRSLADSRYRLQCVARAV